MSEWLSVARQVVETKQHVSPPVPDGLLLDLFTASALVQVHDALSETNAAKLAAMPLAQAVDVTWKLIERTKS